MAEQRQQVVGMAAGTDNEGSHPELQARSRESELEGTVWLLKLSKPATVTYFPQHGHTSYSSPGSTNNWGPSVQTPEIDGVILLKSPQPGSPKHLTFPVEGEI